MTRQKQRTVKTSTTSGASTCPLAKEHTRRNGVDGGAVMKGLMEKVAERERNRRDQQQRKRPAIADLAMCEYRQFCVSAALV